MSTLYVPDHVAKEEKVKLSSVSAAYVDQEDTAYWLAHPCDALCRKSYD